MKFFSDCSGECCVCNCAGHCLAGHGDDDYERATKDQLIERLNLGKYKGSENIMKYALMDWYKYDYDLSVNPSPAKILHHIVDCKTFDANGYTYIICGRSGPTGKTWLKKALKDFGYNVIELSEDLINLVEYNDDKNHFIVNGMENSVLIILNKPIVKK